MPTALITGVTSFIGAHLVRGLLKHDVDVVAMVRPNSRRFERLPTHHRLVVGERDLFQLSGLVKEIAPVDWIFHLAWDGVRGPARDQTSNQERSYKATLEMAKVAGELNAKVFVGAGSQAEYGRQQGLIREEMTEKPDSAYGFYKLQAAREVEKVCDSYGVRYVWPRIFSLYGMWDHCESLIMTCLHKMVRNHSIHLTPCTQMWDYLYVEDAIKALIMLAEKGEARGIYNLAYGEHRPLREFVEEIREVLGSESAIVFENRWPDTKIPANLTPSVKKIRHEIAWIPETSFRRGIQNMRRIIEYEKN